MIEFALSAATPPGSFKALATARTTCQKCPLVDIQLAGEIVGDGPPDATKDHP